MPFAMEKWYQTAFFIIKYRNTGARARYAHAHARRKVNVAADR